jgi:hypothetical protein
LSLVLTGLEDTLELAPLHFASLELAKGRREGGTGGEGRESLKFFFVVLV